MYPSNPLEDYVRNYNPKTDTILCPILYDEVPFNDCVVHTCCFNAFEAKASLMLKDQKCPLCRRKILFSYITLRVLVADPSQYWGEDKYMFCKIGLDLSMKIGDFKKHLEQEFGKRTLKIWRHRLGDVLQIYHSDNRSLSYYHIGSGNMITVWLG